jgi:hypothetical protein
MELNDILEKHFRVDQLVERLGISRRSVTKLVDKHMPQVRVLGQKRRQFGPLRRKYCSRLIPESVVLKIAAELLGAR